ncbi:MAG: hypothetical protein OCD02_01845 [Spirochaetaceae bacterium]
MLNSETIRTEKLRIQFFGSDSCSKCLKIENEILSVYKMRYPKQIDLSFHELQDKEGYLLLEAYEKEFNLDKSYPQFLVVADTYIAGYRNIMDNAVAIIETYLADNEKWKILVLNTEENETQSYLKADLQAFTFLGIFLAGLIDGINPCAIATIIFLISFLSTKKRTKKEIMIVGLCFSFSVYLTYLLLGLGAFKGITMLQNYYLISEIIKWLAIAFSAIVGVICFIDAFNYYRLDELGKIKVQLPLPIKKSMHKIIRYNLKGRSLVLGSILTGFLISLLEAVCTGQVYLPTIILMTNTVGFKAKGFLYLLFYNFLFVLPLLIIIVLSVFGLTWQNLLSITKRRMTIVKVLLGCVMLGLSLFLVLTR